MYIIVWRNSHQDPFVDVNHNGFKETYNSYQEAKDAAETILKTENENGHSLWYFDYQIYQEVNS